jgi:uncharacterized protein YbaP (TraB family)
MSRLFTLRTIFRDTIMRRNISPTSLDSATQTLIADYTTKENDFNTKVQAYEAAKTTADNLQRELINDRNELMTLDTQINREVMVYAASINPTTPTI